MAIFKRTIEEKSTYRDIKDGEYDLPYTTKVHTTRFFGVTIYKVSYVGDVDSEIKLNAKAKAIGFGSTK